MAVAILMGVAVQRTGGKYLVFTDRPRATGLLFMCLRSKGLKMISNSKFCAECENECRFVQSLCVCCEKCNLMISDMKKREYFRKNIFIY